jgi:hypothetical protein
VVALAGARPAQGVPLTHWSLDRLSVSLTERELLISPIHFGRLLAQTGLSMERIRSWKASPDPDYEAEGARILELDDVSPFEGPVISFDQMRPISNVNQNVKPLGDRLDAFVAPKLSASRPVAPGRGSGVKRTLPP